MGMVSPRGGSTGGMSRGAEIVVDPAAPTGGEEADQVSPDAVGKTGGKGVTEYYARNVEEEKDPSVIGAGVFARRVADIGRPGDNGGALAARGFAVAAGNPSSKHSLTPPSNHYPVMLVSLVQQHDTEMFVGAVHYDQGCCWLGPTRWPSRENP